MLRVFKLSQHKPVSEADTTHLKMPEYLLFFSNVSKKNFKTFKVQMSSLNHQTISCKGNNSKVNQVIATI